MFDIAHATDGLSNVDFMENKTRLEPYFKEVVDEIKEFINSIAEEEDYDDSSEDARNNLELVEVRWEQFLSLEAEIEKKLLLDVDTKNVSEVDVDHSEKGHELNCDDLISSVPANLSVASDSLLMRLIVRLRL